MASDTREREAIERVARRIKEQREKESRREYSHEEARKQARDVAIQQDKATGK